MRKQVNEARKNLDNRPATLSSGANSGRDSDESPSQGESLQLTLRLTARDAKKLMNAFLQGKLSEFKISSVTVSGPVPPTVQDKESSPTPDSSEESDQGPPNNEHDFANRVRKQQRKKPQGRE